MTTRRRCVHVFATFGAGGPQMRALQLMARLGSGWTHVVMPMDARSEAMAQLPAGVHCDLVPPPPKAGFLATVRAQRRWLREQAPDLVLTYNWGAIETVVAARSLGLPLAHHEDGFLPDEVRRRLRRRSWLRRLLLRTVPVVVPSRNLQRIATAEWGLRDVHHLPNGVDLVRFAAGPPVADPVLGTVGGLRPEKDHATLLAALARLDASVQAIVVGGGALAEPLRDAARQLGVAARVQWVGPVTDTAAWYRRFAVFVLSSKTEQMPIALLEAMACGLPVVATDVGDVRDMLGPASAPWVVPPGNPAALATALERLLRDAPLRQQLGAENRRLVEARYEAAVCLQRFVALYEATASR